MEQSATRRGKAHVIRRPTATMPPARDVMATVKAPAIDPNAIETSRLMTVSAERDPGRMAIIAAAMVATLVVGFVVGRATASGDRPPATIKVVEVQPAAEPEPAPAPAPDLRLEVAPEPEPEPAPEPAPEPVAVAVTGPEVEAAPAIDDEPERKRSKARRERPLVKLHVRSKPHALVYIDGVPVGFSPVTAQVKAFTPVELTFERNGYQTGSTTVEVTEPTRTIDVSLLPES